MLYPICSTHSEAVKIKCLALINCCVDSSCCYAPTGCLMSISAFSENRVWTGRSVEVNALGNFDSLFAVADTCDLVNADDTAQVVAQVRDITT